jgi:dolichol-phosphate mannosyltransferase
MKALVILPTYNEKDTLPVLIDRILDLEGLDVHIVVVDDNSPDGTRDIARQWSRRDGRVSLLERPAKLGLGTAYVTGFKWGLERDFECFVEMDSDLSHNPFGLPGFIREVEGGNDLVIGSRYMRGTISVLGWDFRRLLMSKFGNFYAATILSLPLSDITSGYRAFSRRALEAIHLDGIHSEGYAFQIEMAYRVRRKGLQIKEIPITFTERYKGTSKMSRAIVREAVWLPWRLRMGSLAGIMKKTALPEEAAVEARNRRV